MAVGPVFLIDDRFVLFKLYRLLLNLDKQPSRQGTYLLVAELIQVRLGFHGCYDAIENSAKR